MIEKLTALLEGFDLTKIVPELDTFLGKLELTVRIAVLMGPLLLVALGALYLFAPPKEANHALGFRSYWSMGSVEAWQYAQKLAGIIWGGLGILLTVIMGIISLTFGGKEAMDMVMAGFTCVMWELGLVLVSYIAVQILVMLRFDKDGNRRK